MRNLFIYFLITISFFSCKKEAPQIVEPIDIAKEIISEEKQICYQGIIKNDTINLQLKILANQEVSGNLSYLFYEKDKNTGTISGKMIGDTLKANYNFFSEGIESSREIIFLRKGKIMIEAYGDTEEIEGKIIFKDPKKLFFDSATVLSETDCATFK